MKISCNARVDVDTEARAVQISVPILLGAKLAPMQLKLIGDITKDMTLLQRTMAQQVLPGYFQEFEATGLTTFKAGSWQFIIRGVQPQCDKSAAT